MKQETIETLPAEVPARREELGEVSGSSKWVMVSDHPYYPNVSYFDTEAEALKEASDEVTQLHEADGRHDESKVFVGRVTMLKNIKTHY